MPNLDNNKSQNIRTVSSSKRALRQRETKKDCANNKGIESLTIIGEGQHQQEHRANNISRASNVNIQIIKQNL